MPTTRTKSLLLAIILSSVFLCIFLLSERSLVQIERVAEPEPEQESDYEKMQSSKLRKHFELIQKMDAEIQPQLRERFKSVFKEHKFEVQGRAALCIGSRLGGEVRALQDLGALAVGIDFNPGEKNKHVLYGSATDLQFASGVFDMLYSNILDHIQDIDIFFREVSRVAKQGSLLLLDLDQNSPDEWSVRDLRGTVDKFSIQVQNMGWKLLSRSVITNEKDDGKIALVFSYRL